MLERTQATLTSRLVTYLYYRLGSRYRWIMALGSSGSSALVAGLTVVTVSLYFSPSLDEVAVVVAVAVTMVLCISAAAWRVNHHAWSALVEWRSTPAPTPEHTVEIWRRVVSTIFEQYRRLSLLINVGSIVPVAALTVWLWDLDWYVLPAVMAVAVVPGMYATMVSFAIGEMLSRPMVEDVADQLPDDFEFRLSGPSIYQRLAWGVRAYTVVTGLLVGTLLGSNDGVRDLLLVAGVSVVVGMGVSHELVVLLWHAINRPLTDVRDKLAKVRDGDFQARARVESTDEVGELAHDFNLMAAGLQKREEMRDAFGTYVDRRVAEVILEGDFPQEGQEVEVSILFCDIRGFTTYAERTDATRVIATLNRVFAAIVPVVNDHQGHVDKFMGDGLLAVFGAPTPLKDHADRAVNAASDIVAAVHALGLELSMAAGVNSGTVVAGPVGGGGRLNFSVIGDVVNTAARVEAATRRTGDDLLITAATRDLLTQEHQLVSRGGVRMKGKADPVEVFARTRQAE